MDNQQFTVLSGANAMPAFTWHHLKMNDAEIRVPANLAVEPAVAMALSDGAQGYEGAFEYSLAMLQSWWEAHNPASDATTQAQLDAVLAPDKDATYGGTAQSRYQMRADAIEAARSLEAAFETGVGEQASTLLRQAAKDPIVVVSNEGETVNATITVMGVDGTFSAACIEVIAAMNSTVNLNVVVDSPEAQDEASGFTGTTIRVLAGFDSKVNITRMQTLDDGFTDIDDMGLLAANNARINVRQFVMGGQASYTGLACDLRGQGSYAGIDLHYLGHGTQLHDINYLVRHHGKDTQCNIQANGVLAGESQKTLRGTIDLVRGCKGAQGNERETVLLVDPAVRNKTVPVILCNEDDVAGNHGATIGHVSAEQLQYLKARGLSQQQVEALFMEASFDYAAQQAPTEQAAAGVDRLARTVLGHSVLLDDSQG